jgi:hypothetical protein
MEGYCACRVAELSLACSSTESPRSRAWEFDQRRKASAGFGIRGLRQDICDSELAGLRPDRMSIDIKGGLWSAVPSFETALASRACGPHCQGKVSGQLSEQARGKKSRGKPTYSKRLMKNLVAPTFRSARAELTLSATTHCQLGQRPRGIFHQPAKALRARRILRANARRMHTFSEAGSA